MADGFTAKDASGNNVPIITDQVTDATLGTGQVQYVKIMDGTIDGTTKAAVGANGLKVDGSGATQPVSGTISVSSGPAAARTTDSISAALATDAVMNGLTALAPTYQKIVASASGATTIVNGVTSKKIRVLAWWVVANGAVNVKWQSHVTPTDLTGLSYLTTNGGLVVPFSPVGWFETVAGEALDINLSGAVAVGGTLVYVTV